MIWISSDRDDRRIFGGRKILASIFLGIQNLCFSFHVISFKGVSLEALGIFFLGFDFCPHSIISIT